ncbi:MAG: hypothetical protein ACLSTO_07710 [Bilophila wadsworthia]
MHRLDAHIPGLADAVFARSTGFPNLNVPPSGRPAPSRRTNVDCPRRYRQRATTSPSASRSARRNAATIRTISVSLLH